MATESAKAVPAELLGKWVVAGDGPGRGDTGTLELKADWTFESDYKMPKEPAETYSGTFTVGTEEIEGTSLETVMLKVKLVQGKPDPDSTEIRLFFDRKASVLHDFLTVAYTRPGKEGNAKNITIPGL